jgi:hypothetical protein
MVYGKAKPKDMAGQLFREYCKCIFVGKCTRQKKVVDNQAESSGGKHVTRARGWWKRGDVAACDAQTNMHCWCIKTHSSRIVAVLLSMPVASCERDCCCLLVLNTVTSTPQWIHQQKPCGCMFVFVCKYVLGRSRDTNASDNVSAAWRLCSVLNLSRG